MISWAAGRFTGAPLSRPLADTRTKTRTRSSSTSKKRSGSKRIAAHPENFYVNVHNAAYPDGAIRGQLGLAL